MTQDDALRPAATARLIVGSRLKQLRLRRGMETAAQLADKCAELGAPDLTRDVIANLESSRRDVSVERLLVLALACDVAPLDLLMPPDFTGTVAVTGEAIVTSEVFAQWLSGNAPLPQSDPVAFAANTVQRLAPSSVQNFAADLVRSVVTQQALSERAGTNAVRLAETRQKVGVVFASLRSAIESGADRSALLAVLDAAEADLDRPSTD